MHVMLGINLEYTLQITNNTEFVQNILSGQKIKLADQVRKINPDLVWIKSYTCETPKNQPTIRIEEYNMVSTDDITPEPIFYPSVNTLSFNPYIYKMVKRIPLMNDGILIFVTVGTDAYRMLLYDTDMDIIATMSSKQNNTISCVCRANKDECFTIALKSVASPIFSKVSFTGDGSVQCGTKLSKEQLKEFRRLDFKRRSRPIRFKFSAPEKPRYMVTKGTNRLKYLNDAHEAGIIDEIIEINVEDENFDFHDAALTSGLLGEKLRRTRAIICAPGVTFSPSSMWALGISYAFKLSYDKDKHPYIGVIRSK